MTRFAQRILSDDRIEAEPARIHAVLVDPDRLAELTPLVAGIAATGDRWRWQLVGISALGIEAAPAFTTIMTVTDERISFEPDPRTGDRATATGSLTVQGEPSGRTLVAIDLLATVELPLPRMARSAVSSVMYSTMKLGGSRFADNLLEHLGNPERRGLRVRARDDSRP